MIVNDLNIFSTRVRPPEAHTELIVHADAVLAGSAPSAVTLYSEWGEVGSLDDPALELLARRP